MSTNGKKSEVNIPTDIDSAAISWDINAFDEFIRSQGVKLVHYAAVKCPIGMTDVGDNRQPHEHHANCSNGFLYTKVGCITSLMQGNSNQQSMNDIGFIEGSSCQVTFPRMYDDSENPVYIAPFDRFYLDEEALQVITWETIKARQNGIDRTKFPIGQVLQIVDANGIYYDRCIDYEIENGDIVWLPGGKRPGETLDVQVGGTDRGTVISIRYTYRPFWYCYRLLHELRVSQSDEFGLERVVVKMPQLAILNREFVYRNENVAGTDLRSLRQLPDPKDGGFGNT